MKRQVPTEIDLQRTIDGLRRDLDARTAELAEARAEQAATGDVLKVISGSAFDLQAVLDTLVETVAQLCRSDQALIFRRRDNLYHLAAAHGLSDQGLQYVLANPLAAGRGTLSGRVDLERRAVHIADVTADPEYTYQAGQKIQGHRTALGVPLL